MPVGKTLLLTTAATIVAWGSASAADIYVPVEPAPYIAPEKEWNWTGIHVGIDTGGQFDFVQSDVDVDHDDGPNGVELPDKADLGAQNWFVSGDIGADYQVGNNFVLGILANYDWSPSDSSDSHSAFVIEGDDNPCDAGCKVGNTVTYGDAWGVGGRAGFLINPKTLVYGLGGYGMKQINAKSFFSFDGSGETGSGGLSGGGWQPGWFVGGGIEAAVRTHATLALEYRYAEYDGFSAFCNPDQQPCGFLFDEGEVKHGFDVDTTASHTIRARFSLWFN